ncbi:hypothetical protein OB920_19155 [Halobacteria archaeon HArc-gm2]|nr:hypothetical protein [Halobacteria archaeon HArc-gm2]
MPAPEEDNTESEVVILSESNGDEEESIIITMNDLTGKNYEKEIRWEFGACLDA